MKNNPSLLCLRNTLGPLEYKVMKNIWDNGEKTTVRDLVNFQKENKKTAYTTIMTVVNHLYNKGFLKREKVKKTYYYAPIIERNYAIKSSLSKVFSDLNRDYGKRRILYLAISNSFLPNLSIELPPYALPVLYGILFTFLSSLFVLSAYDLIQNINVFATESYLNLLTSDLSLFAGRIQFALALLESLPIADILASTISLILVFLLIKKLSKVLDIRIFVVG